MKIVVIGGTGLIGSKLVTKLRADGHDPLAASPATGVDIITGQGLAEALAGAHVVVDVSNAPNWGDAEVMDFFQTSARNILAAETAAGIGHHVALSVVGTERLQGSGYFRAKLAQEERIKAAAIPSTILRATQFFEFIGRIADSSTQDGTSFVWKPGDKFELLNENKMEEHMNASLAFSDGQVFVRTYKALYCVGKRKAG